MDTNEFTAVLTAIETKKQAALEQLSADYAVDCGKLHEKFMRDASLLRDAALSDKTAVCEQQTKYQATEIEKQCTAENCDEVRK